MNDLTHLSLFSGIVGLGRSIADFEASGIRLKCMVLGGWINETWEFV